MADTLGGLIDKLFTVDMKMWNNQEFLYEIRRITFEDFETKFNTEEGRKALWNSLKKVCDLNVQRSNLIDEIDEKIVEIVKGAVTGEDLDGKFVQRKHKTY